MHQIRKLRLEITNGCPLTCDHCSVAAGPLLGSEMSKDSATKLLHDFKAQGGEEVVLTGGEPLLHPQFEDIASFAQRCGLWTSVFSMGIDRQGRALNLPHAMRLRGIVDEWWVSILGSTSWVHDAITRSPSSLEKTLAAARALVDAGIPVKATFVVRSDNVGQLQEIASVCQDVGIIELRVLSVVPQGRAKKLAGSLAIYLDCLTTAITIARGRAPGVLVRIGQAAKASYRVPNACGAIENELVVNWDGWVSPCHSWEPQPSCEPADNVFQTSLEEVLGKSPRLQACLDALGDTVYPGCSDGCLTRKVLSPGGVLVQAASLAAPSHR